VEYEVYAKLTPPRVMTSEATTQYGEDEVLYAANNDEDAEKVHSLMKGNEMITIKSGHDIHFEHPDEFI